MKLAPCKDCPDRCVGCHAVCEKYITWNKEHTEELEQRHQSRVTTKIFEEIKYRNLRRKR